MSVPQYMCRGQGTSLLSQFVYFFVGSRDKTRVVMLEQQSPLPTDLSAGPS